jgi:transcriptional regulator with XRE-family HTH domain
MTRRKTIPELRIEIMASAKLRSKSQEEIARSLRLNQATLSRIRRGRFKRYSNAVTKVCSYALISRMTDRPPPALGASLERLTLLAKGRSTNERHAMKLIRLAAELLESGEAQFGKRLRTGS